MSTENRMKEKIQPLINYFDDLKQIGFVVTHSADYFKASEHACDVSHIHDVCEIYLNGSGNVSFVVENAVYPVSRGDLIITRPDEFHHCVYHEDGVCEHYCMWIDGAPKNLLRAFFERQSGEKNLISANKEQKERLIECFNVLKNAGEVLSLEALKAFVEILSIIDENRNSDCVKVAVPDLLIRITEYIDENFDSDCSVENLCKRFFISRSTLCRLFRANLTTTPSKYVTSRRLSQAKKMLKSGCSVGDTCFSCGFTDYSHFIALFRERFGVTPMKYARTRSDESDRTVGGEVCH